MQPEELQEIAQSLAVAVAGQNKLAEQLLKVTTLQSQIIADLIDTVQKLVDELQVSQLWEVRFSKIKQFWF